MVEYAGCKHPRHHGAGKVLGAPLLAMLLIALAVGTAAAAGVKTVALLPLRMNADREMLYLRDGIHDMVTARLFAVEGLSPLSRQAVMRLVPAPLLEVSEPLARDLGRRLGVDYVVFGGASLLGQAVSLDLKVVDVRGGLPTKSFFGHSADSAGVMSCIEAVTADIRGWLLQDAHRTLQQAREGAQGSPGEDRGPSRASEAAAPPRAPDIAVPVRVVPAPPSPSASPRTPPVQSVSPAAAAATPWTVQAAALRTEPEAARLASELQAKGYPARVERADIPDKGVWFRVRISGFAAAADTRETVERLRRDGFAAVVLPTRTGR